jgi:hypothetical protein
MLSLAEQRKFLNDLIVARHAELARFTTILSLESYRVGRLGNRLKLLTIILGAFSAAQGIMAEIYDKASIFRSAVFALIGICIAMIAGVEVAFKFETRASELRMLAARCRAARFQHNSEWAHRIAIAKPSEAIAASRELLAIQDQTLSEVQFEAAKLGVNIAVEVRNESKEQAETDKALYDPFFGPPADHYPTRRAASDMPIPPYTPYDDDLPPPLQSSGRRRPSDKG